MIEGRVIGMSMFFDSFLYQSMVSPRSPLKKPRSRPTFSCSCVSHCMSRFAMFAGRYDMPRPVSMVDIAEPHL